MTVTVRNTLVGMYVYPLIRTWGAHTATLPSGEIRNSYCYFHHIGGAQAAGPGIYTFGVAGAGIGATIDSDVYLILVDARIPS